MSARRLWEQRLSRRGVIGTVTFKDLLSSRKMHSALGMALSVLLLGWIVLSADWSRVFYEFSRCNYWMLIPCVAVLVLHMFLRSLRWRYLLPDEADEVSNRTLFDALMVGSFATFLLPLRAGEFVRPYMLARESKLSFPVCFVSVVIERFFDLSFILGMFGVMIVFVPNVPDWANAGALTLGVLALGLLAFLLIGAALPRWAEAIMRWVGSFLPEPIERFALRLGTELLRGSAVIRSGSKLTKVIALTVLVWGTAVAQFYFTLLLFSGVASWGLAVALVVIVALAVAAPSAPGFLGVFQVACVAAFALYQANEEVGVAFSFIAHATQYATFVCYGGYVLIKKNLRVADLRQGAERSTPA